MSASIGFSVLAAGQGTRLKLGTAKVLAPVLGKRLIDFPLMAIEEFLSQHSEINSHIGIVTGHMREEVESYLNSRDNKSKVSFALQEKQLGTADALRSYFAGTPGAENQDYTFVICGDTPLISSENLSELYNFMIENKKLQGVAASFITPDPTGYGRIVKRDEQARGFHIIEEKDADEEIREINEVNSGLYLVKTSFLKEHLSEITAKNKAKEFYLTDIFQDDFDVVAYPFENEEDFLGVNTLKQLEEASLLLLERKIDRLRGDGVQFVDSSTFYMDWDISIGPKCKIYPNVFIEGQSSIGSHVQIEPGCVIKDSKISDGVQLRAYSYLEEAEVFKGSVIGPFARLRPGTQVGEDCKIGNFVETKKAVLDRGVKISHLSYVGDAEVGEDSNIGCGFITCNYDGKNKHKTKIGSKTFIGSDCQAIAPVSIGNSSFVAAGSTITNDIPDGGFGIARSRQVTKEGLAKKFLK